MTTDAYRRRKREDYHRNKTRWAAMRIGLDPDTVPDRPEHCDACGRRPSARRGLAIDHCHRTGKFRGWLCVQCNAGIGLLGDTVEALARAMVYLKRAEAK